MNYSMATEVYQVLQDTSLPRAVALISDDEITGKTYQTEGRAYNAGDFVLRSDITPSYHDAIDDGQFDAVLAEADMSDYEEWAADQQGMVWAPEHGVEAEAMARAGHRLVDRETLLKLRSVGAEDAADRIEAQKEELDDSRPNLTFKDTPNLVDPDDDSNPQIEGAEYVDEDVATEARVQVTPSGLMANNPNKTPQELASDSDKRSRPSRSRSRPRARQASSSGDEAPPKPE